MNAPKSFCVGFILLFLSFPGLAQRDYEDAAREIVTTFYVAFEKKNETSLKQLWKIDSPHLAAFFKQAAAQFAEKETVSIRNVEFRNSSFKDEIFRLRVSVEIQAKVQNLTFQFVEEAKAWKIWRIRPSDDDLAFQLASAESDAERDNLLTINQGFQTVQLCDSAVREARNLQTRGRFSQANRILDFADNLAKKLGSKSCLAHALSTRGSVRFGQGEYREAAKVLFEGLDIGQQLNDLPLQADVYRLLGLTVVLQGNMAMGKEYYEKSLTIAERIGDKGRMSRILNNLANISGNAKTSILLFERVINLAEESNTPHIVAYGIGNIGTAYATLGDYDKAIEYMLEARQRLETLDLQHALIEAYTSLAEFYFKQGNYAESLVWAEKGYQQTIKLSAQRDNVPGPLNRKFEIYRKLGDFGKARSIAEEAVTFVEKMREKVSSEEYSQTRFLGSRSQAYHNLILNLSETGEKEKALAAAELFKGRVLWDVIRTGKTQSSRALSDEERGKEKQLKLNVFDLNRTLEKENQKEYQNKPRIAELENKLKQARFASEEFQIRLYATKPELKIQRGEFQPISMNEIAALFPNEKAAFLEFAVTDEKTFLYVITKENGKPRLEIYSIEIKKEDLRKRADEYRAVVSDSKLNLDYKEKGRKIYDLLLAPAREQLNGITSIVVIPDSFLWEIPFQALLRAEDRFLVEDFTISYATSLTVLREMRKRQSPPIKNPKLLAFGNPRLGSAGLTGLEKLRGEKFSDLPSAEKEVELLSNIYGAGRSTIYKNAAATESVFKTNAKDFNILHFATHGLLNNLNPMYSALVLSSSGNSPEDGLLEAWELMELNLKADVAVLSACESGRGTSIGEGIVGLSWAFFVAGVPRVVASQWKVDSKSTAELMVEFHRSLQSPRKRSVPEALRLAMLNQSKKPGRRHPFYWAAFVAIGPN